MADKFEIKTTLDDDKVVVEFIGSIDEDSVFTELTDLEKVKHYEFNFDKVEMINSCGVREWTSFVKELGEDCHIVYKNCRQIIIEQINMVHGFIPSNASIETFYAPYYCEELDKEYKILLSAKDIKDKKAPDVKCPDGEYQMEFDAIEGQYFNFIK